MELRRREKGKDNDRVNNIKIYYICVGGGYNDIH
jgi:hypothetical protein